MDFKSVTFLLFLPVVLGLFYAWASRRWRTWLLVVASYVFYGAWDWRFLFLLLASTVIDFFCGRAIEAGRKTAAGKSPRLPLIISLCSNLGILGVFKYFDFFSESATSLLQTFGMAATPFTLNVVLPVGISFYTFQTLSYTINVYRGKLAAERSFPTFALYVSFFPQLVAGPIERATRLLPQLQELGGARWQQVREGCWLILYGYFLKVFVADNMADIANGIFAQDDPGGLVVLLGAYAFAFQIYGDFGGYSSIARGIARLFGVELMLNFNAPYLSRTPSEFWQRWHISLSSWLRDYLYIPLGGNRLGERRTYINLFLTMLLGGLWHGAAWTFVIWGILHGILLIVYRLVPRLRDGFRSNRFSPLGILQILVWFHLTCLTWLAFRAESLPHLLSMLGGFSDLGIHLGSGLGQAIPLFAIAAPLVVLDLWQLRSGDIAKATELPLFVRTPLYAILFLLIVVAGEFKDYDFIYFQF